MDLIERLRIFVQLAAGSVPGEICEPIKDLGEELQNMAEENEADMVRLYEQNNNLRSSYDTCDRHLDIANNEIKDLHTANATFRAQVDSLMKDVERLEKCAKKEGCLSFK